MSSVARILFAGVLFALALLFIWRLRPSPTGVLDMATALVSAEEGESRLVKTLEATFGRPWKTTTPTGDGPRRFDLVSRDALGRTPDLVGCTSYLAEGGIEIGVLALPPPGVSEAYAERQVLGVARLFVPRTPDLDRILETLRTTGPGPLWHFAEPAKTKGLLVLYSPPRPEVFAASGFQVIAIRGLREDRQIQLESFSARLAERIARGDLSFRAPTPGPTASPAVAPPPRVHPAFRTELPLVTGEIGMSEALRRYREMCRTKGMAVSMSFAQVAVSGPDANLVAIDRVDATGLLWVTLQAQPEGVLIGGGLPLHSKEATGVQALPMLPIGSRERMPGQLVWSGSLVRAREHPMKGLVFEVNDLALEWRPR